MLLEVAMMAASCGPTDDVLANLKNRYNEIPAYHADLNDTNGSQLVVTVSATGKTWSIIVQPSKELSCVVAVGSDWHPDFGEADDNWPFVLRPYWPPVWPDGICTCGDYVRGPI